MNADVDKFFKKAKQWQPEMVTLRTILVETELEEDFKWSLPCYTYQGHNVAIIQPFKNFFALMFFKGTLLKDPKEVLNEVGPNSQAARRLEFGSAQEIMKLKSTIKAYIKEAITIEESGQKVEFKKHPQPMPDELKTAFAKNAKLKKAFEALTPGRQRTYILHFAGAKQAATRQSRIEKWAPHILKGKGFNDR